jgi:hypothetical protein
LESISVTIIVINVRRKINKIISHHNDIVYVLEEENRLLQNRLLSIPKEVLVSVEKMIAQNPDSAAKTIKYLIQTDGLWSSDVFNELIKERQKDCCKTSTENKNIQS